MDRKEPTQMKHSLFLFAASIALALAATAQSQAEMFQYSYSWTVSPGIINLGIISAGPGAGVVLTSNEGGATNVDNVDTDTAAANVKWYSSASSNKPDFLPPPPSGRNYNYTAAVTLGDGVAGDPTGTITFRSLLGGSLTHDTPTSPTSSPALPTAPEPMPDKPSG
jgi:hypothetical protein